MWLRFAVLLFGYLMPAFCALIEAVSRELARERRDCVERPLPDERPVAEESRANAEPRRDPVPDLAKVADPLALDFRGDGVVRELKVNDSAEEIKRSNGHILISRKHLRRGHNQIELDFESGVAEANRAVTRYIDSQDGNEYLYTLFVPMDASLAFPCFDQPDLKARFTLTVDSPADWVVVSNTRARRYRARRGSKKRSQSVPICSRLQRGLSKPSRAQA